VVREKMRIKSKAQSLTEYTICLTIVLIAFFGMQFYVKRGLQARYKDVVDDVTKIASAQKQYEPHYREDVIEVEPELDITEEMVEKGKGKITRTISKNTTTQKGSFTETIDAK
jgi:DNA polymerase/3'-5' exonuclease PolX